MFSLQVIASAVCFSSLVALSSSLNKVVDMGALEMSVRRFAIIGGLCIALLAAFPKYVCGGGGGPQPKAHALAFLSGIAFFAASLLYISMTRQHGVVRTSIATTATSFVAITVAGFILSESVALVDVAAMVAITLVTVAWRVLGRP
jgi:drug/metabolite transporter (DMT)-like permease